MKPFIVYRFRYVFLSIILVNRIVILFSLRQQIRIICMYNNYYETIIVNRFQFEKDQERSH